MRQVITTWHQRDYQEWYRRKIVCSPSIMGNRKAKRSRNRRERHEFKKMLKEEA